MVIAGLIQWRTLARVGRGAVIRLEGKNKMKMRKTSRLMLGAAVLAAGIVTIAAAMGAGRLADEPLVLNASASDLIVPRVRIIQWDDSVARFDTQTGAIHRFNGDLEKPNVRSEWISHVKPVRESTSSVLEIQKPAGVHSLEATFLVDVISGETWILRRRGSNAGWDKVDVFR